jgi:hypothetical protein
VHVAAGILRSEESNIVNSEFSIVSPDVEGFEWVGGDVGMKSMLD